MTTFRILPDAPTSAPDKEVDDLMAAMNALCAADKPKRKPKSDAPAAQPEPVFVQMWFPHAIVMHAVEQRCNCCENTYESISGMFLEDRHRNGATRQVRHSGNVVPPDYYNLPTRQQWTIESIPFCVICFQTEFKAELAPDNGLPMPERELTMEDRKELSQVITSNEVEMLADYAELLREEIAAGGCTEAEADALYDERLRGVREQHNAE